MRAPRLLAVDKIELDEEFEPEELYLVATAATWKFKLKVAAAFLKATCLRRVFATNDILNTNQIHHTGTDNWQRGEITN
jgi:hypothetical protein